MCLCEGKECSYKINGKQSIFPLQCEAHCMSNGHIFHLCCYPVHKRNKNCPQLGTGCSIPRTFDKLKTTARSIKKKLKRKFFIYSHNIRFIFMFIYARSANNATSYRHQCTQRFQCMHATAAVTHFHYAFTCIFGLKCTVAAAVIIDFNHLEHPVPPKVLSKYMNVMIRSHTCTLSNQLQLLISICITFCIYPDGRLM